MENKSIQETLKRFTELITEENLYGGLVDKSLLLESSTSKLRMAIKSLSDFGENLRLKTMDFDFDVLKKLKNELTTIQSIDVSKIKNTTKSLDEINVKLDDIKERVNALLTEKSIEGLPDAEKRIQRELKLVINDGIDATKDVNEEIKKSIDTGTPLIDDTQNFIKDNYSEDFLKKVETNITSKSKFLSSSLGKKLTLAKAIKSKLVKLVNYIPKEIRTPVSNGLNFLINPLSTKPLKLNDKITLGLWWKYYLLSWAWLLIINQMYCKFFYSWKDKYNLDDLNKKSVSDLSDNEVNAKIYLQLEDALGVVGMIGMLIPNPLGALECVEGKLDGDGSLSKVNKILKNNGINISNEDIKTQLNNTKSKLENEYNIDATFNEISKMTPEQKRNMLSDN